jgi:ankyrin repeat protein
MHRIPWLILAVALAVLAADVSEDLLSAARNGELGSVKALVEKGAPLEAKTAYGQTPLYLAAMNGHEDVVAYLLEKGANTDVRDTFYKAPMLGFALQRKHYGVVKLLIAKGGGNPDDNLMAVARSGNAELVQVALDKGKPSQSSLDSAYEAALARKQIPVAELLKKAGAQEPAPEASVDVKILESYAGVYKTDQFPLDIKVFVKDGKLYIQATGQPEIAPKARSATVFEFAPAQLQVEFDSSSSFTLKQGGASFKLKKAVSQ